MLFLIELIVRLAVFLIVAGLLLGTLCAAASTVLHWTGAAFGFAYYFVKGFCENSAKFVTALVADEFNSLVRRRSGQPSKEEMQARIVSLEHDLASALGRAAGLSRHADQKGICLALGSAILFGASTPLSKSLLGEVHPLMMAGLLYLGAGIGLAAIQMIRSGLGIPSPEAPLRRADLPWLVLVVLAGGVLGPILLMFGLQATRASTASLLLNIEAVATMVIAWIAFNENVDRRLLLGAAAIVVGAVMLSWQPGGQLFGWGAFCVIAACLAWALDNNLTRKLSSSDPVQIAMLKGLAAGAVNLALAVSAGASWPTIEVGGEAMVVGLFGYGISIAMFVLGLRHLGTARTGAYFSTAPFVGAVLGIVLLGEPMSLQLFLAGALMAFGVYLHITEDHEHAHRHASVLHDHVHVHDVHHDHADADDHRGMSAGVPHAHVHQHDPLAHRHRHYPDAEHRHPH
jgi:drug/metabolite transporter (DMT)-like permease